MSCLTFRRAAVSISIVCLAVSYGSAREPSIENAKQIEKLIGELASRNPVPKEGGFKGDVVYPPAYDKEMEKVPYQVARQLTKFGPRAFPILMKHAQDKAFSCLRESPSGAMRVISVGTVCEQIVAVQLNVFESVGVYPRNVPDYFDTQVHGEKFEAWWDDHKEMTLREIQLEVFEWALDEQKRLIQEWKPRASSQEITAQGQSYERLLVRMKESRTKNKSQLKLLRNADKALVPKAPVLKHIP